jgi:nucleotide-binding universal stress UspA family protein
MDEHAHPRVVVGVATSIHGLAALRAAVAEARTRGLPLHAIRSHNSVQTGEGVDMIRSAFVEALGEVPGGLEIHLTAICSPVVQALTDCAHDPRDLIVVGDNRRGTWHSMWSGSIARSLIHRARCPVLAVPAPEMARAIYELEHRRARADSEDLWEQFERPAPELRGGRHIDS